MKFRKIPLVHVVAMDRDNGIGLGNALPWPRIPLDMKRFKQLTINNPIILGSKTFKSIGKLLPNRTNIVVSKSNLLTQEGLVIKNSIESAIDYAENVPFAKAIYIIGGGEIYNQTLDIVDTIYQTIVHGHYITDTKYPAIPYQEFHIVSEEEISGDPGLTFVTLARKS